MKANVFAERNRFSQPDFPSTLFSKEHSSSHCCAAIYHFANYIVVSKPVGPLLISVGDHRFTSEISNNGITGGNIEFSRI